MSGHILSLEDLRDCMTSTAPVELMGMRLLKERPHFLSASPQVSRDELIEAVTEIIEYTGRCVTRGAFPDVLP